MFTTKGTNRRPKNRNVVMMKKAARLVGVGTVPAEEEVVVVELLVTE